MKDVKNVIEYGKNFVRKVWDEGKKALLIASTVGVLAWWLTSCDGKRTDFYKFKDAVKIQTEFTNTLRTFDAKAMVSLSPSVLYEDDKKTVILFSNVWTWIQCAITYKSENKKDVYSNLANPDNMQVTTIENGKATRNNEKASAEEAKKLLEDVTSYMK